MRILQDFSLTPLPTNSDLNIDYALAPLSWQHSAFSLTNRRTNAGRAGDHPLLDLAKLAQNLVQMNALVLDLTELWYALHEKNIIYRVYEGLGDHKRVTFKVFAHLGGNAFIWYGIVPAYLAESRAVSPHVFFSPADYAEKQNVSDERKYLFDNAAHFDGLSGATLMYGYILPPVDDDRIPDVNQLRDFDPAFLELRDGYGRCHGFPAAGRGHRPQEIHEGAAEAVEAARVGDRAAEERGQLLLQRHQPEEDHAAALEHRRRLREGVLCVGRHQAAAVPADAPAVRQGRGDQGPGERCPSQGHHRYHRGRAADQYRAGRQPGWGAGREGQDGDLLLQRIRLGPLEGQRHQPRRTSRRSSGSSRTR